MKKLFLLLFFPSLLAAQSTNPFRPPMDGSEWIGQANGISTAFPFVRIAPDARAGGMGDGSVALSNDANAMYWNPSRLAFNKTRYGFAATYIPWLRALVPDLNYFYTAAYFKPDSISAIGVSASYFTSGGAGYYSGASVISGVISNAFTTDIAYSRQVRKNISIGLTGRYIRSNHMPYVDFNSSGFGGDIGFSWIGSRRSCAKWQGHFQSGVAITNIGPKVDVSWSTSDEFMPTNLALAFGGEFEKEEKHFIAFQVQANKLLVPSPPVYARDSAGNPIWSNGNYLIVAGKDPNRSAWQGMTGSFSDAPGGAEEEFQEIMWSAGFEYDYKRMVKARTGIFYEHALKGNRKYVTFGAGGRYKNVSFDVSYLHPINAQRSPLRGTMKFTLLIHWNKFGKTA